MHQDAGNHRKLHSFPTRRSSDLERGGYATSWPGGLPTATELTSSRSVAVGDRKSTRLNSSHPSISYAVFCKKKKNESQFEATKAQIAKEHSIAPKNISYDWFAKQ